MHCDRFEQRLNELLDRRANPLHDRRLARHAQHCATCRDLLETQRLVLSVLQRQTLERRARSWATSPSAGHPQPRRPVQSLTQTSGHWLALLTAACLAALVLGRWITQPGSNQHRSEPTNVASVPRRQAPDTPPATNTAMGRPAALVALPPLAIRPDDAATPPWANWRELDLRWLLPETEEVPQLSKSQLLDRVRRVGGTIRPLTSSVSSTLNILKRTWPGRQSPAKPSSDQAVVPAESDLLA